MFNEKNMIGTVRDGVELEKLPFAHIRDYVGKELTNIVGFYINRKGNYQPQVVLVTETEQVDLPSYATSTFENFTTEEIEAVKMGKMKLTNIKEMTTKNGKTISWKYVDC